MILMRFGVWFIACWLVVAACGCRGSNSGCVRFDGLTPGTRWGGQVATPEGTIILTEKNVPIAVQPLMTGATPQYNLARVDAGVMGSGNAILTSSITLQLDFTNYHVHQVSFYYLHKDGPQNISVNGADVYVGDLRSAPTDWPDKVRMRVTTLLWPSGGKLGRVVLQGRVKTLRVGGVEFWVDEFCVNRHPPRRSKAWPM